MARKVAKDFFCIESKVSYKAGDVYNGNRTDLEHVLEPVKGEKKPAPPEAPPIRTIAGEKKEQKPKRTKKERK